MRTKLFYQLVLVCFALLLGGVNQAWAQTVTYDLSTWADQKLPTTANQTLEVNSLTFYGGSGAAYAAGSKTFDDGTTFNGRIKFGGKSTFKKGSLSRVFSFEVTGDCTIKVYAQHGSSTGTRTAYMSQSITTTDRDVSTAIASCPMVDGNAGYMVGDAKKGTVYIWSDNNIGIYGIVITYKSTDPTPATVSIAETTLTAGVGTPVALKATVGGNPTPTIQWYQCDDINKTNAKAIDKATTATYEYTPSAAGTYYFYCTATNESGEATSDVVTVNVLDKILSADATISSIVVNGLTTELKNNIYTATTIGATTITAVITTTDENATVTGGKEQTIEAGKATTITVTAEDGKTTATYTLNVTNVGNVTRTANAFYIGSGKPYAAGQTFTCPDIVATIAAESNPSGNMTNDGSKPHYINSNYVSAVSGNVNGKADSKTGKPTAGSYFTFTPSKDGSLEVGIYLNANKELWISDGEKRLVAGTDFTAAFKSNETTEQVLTDNKLSTAAAGTITFDVIAGKTYYVYCTGSKMGWYGMEFTPAAENYALTTADADFYTLYLDYDATIPAGIEVYSSVLSEDKTVMTVNKVEGTVLPANTAVLLKSPAGAGEFTFEHASEAAATVETALLGVTETTPYAELTPEGKTLLTLGTKDGVVAFRKPYAADGSLAANRAYLLLDNTTGEAKSIRVVIGGDDTTGISEVNAAKAEAEAPIYNMAGQRVAAGTKGLLIKNGKKYINK